MISIRDLSYRLPAAHTLMGLLGFGDIDFFQVLFWILMIGIVWCVVDSIL